jgi:hypothetical protein
MHGPDARQVEVLPVRQVCKRDVARGEHDRDATKHVTQHHKQASLAHPRSI